jgi:tRNA(Ile)-lysidine synthase
VTKSLLNSKWFSRLQEFSQLIVGFSGGLDSTVLLHVLADTPELRHKLLAVHINHGINPKGLDWQHHCEQWCLNLGISFISHSVQFDRRANIENRARNARYHVFSSLVNKKTCLILGHHLNDQAETMLLQLFRGTGIDGLSAMSEVSTVGSGALLRPFLSYPREYLESYASLHGLKWIEDESNEDINYSRNYVRHQIMPLLVEKWPGVVENISRAASHCQQAKANLSDLAMQDSPDLVSASNTLFVEPLKKLSGERITNVLRVWLKKNQVELPSSRTFQRLIDEMVFARSDAQSLVSWDDIQIHCYQGTLYLGKKEVINSYVSMNWITFPSPVVLGNGLTSLVAHQAREGLIIPIRAKIVISFRQGGELFFWHGQTKQLKKLFQEWKIPPWQRDKVPLLYINDQLAAVIGYAISDLFYSRVSGWQFTLSSETPAKI